MTFPAIIKALALTGAVLLPSVLNARTATNGAATDGPAATAPDTKIEWSTLGNITTGPDAGHYIQRFVITGNTDFNRFAFNQFARHMKPLSPDVTLSEIIPGYYEVAFPVSAGKDTVTIDILTKGSLIAICYTPDGVHKINPDGTSAPVSYVNRGIIEFPAQWSTPQRDLMPAPSAIYARNSRLQQEARAFRQSPSSQYALIPSLKQLSLTGKHTSGKKLRLNLIEDPLLGDTLKITVSGDTFSTRLSPDSPEGRQRVMRLYERLSNLPLVAEAVITDYPDHSYRGVMIDIARNYQTPSEMRRVIDMMARYGLNVLHFHVADDEAWRVEIPGLPELTDLGARRGYTRQETDFLAQIFCGDGNPDNNTNTSNGYFSREDFVNLLRYADGKGITVLPEIESPGHARAAIKAMERRARLTGDTSMLLSEKGDTSRYTSAQAFHDNVMNPALPGPYVFMEKVIDGIAAMYDEAGVSLPAIHIGGDEVPRGAWSGSPSAIRFMAENGMTAEKQLHAHFVERINSYLTSKGILMSGWSEIAVGHSDNYDGKVSPNVYSVNCWHSFSDKPQSEVRQALRRGYPVVISNVDYFYLDQWYTPHPMERGLNWGGIVDEYRTLSGTRDKFSRVLPEDRGKIIGVSGQLFSETVRSAAGLEDLLFPKMLGLAERGWNADSTYTDGAFASVVVEQEIPFWLSREISFHVGQPGINHLPDGTTALNAPYEGIGMITYTLDGTEPSASSTPYTGPFVMPSGAKELRAAYFIGPRRSVTTIDRQQSAK